MNINFGILLEAKGVTQSIPNPFEIDNSNPNSPMKKKNIFFAFGLI